MILFKETRFSLLRHRLQFFLFSVSLCLAALIVVIGVIVLQLGEIIRNDLLRQFELEIFFSPSLTQKDYDLVLQDLKSKTPPGTKFRFISQDEAKQIFIDEFGDELLTLIGGNPLPASVILTLPSQLSHSNSVRNLQFYASQLNGVDEAVYEGELASFFEYKYQELQVYFISIGSFIFLIMVILSLMSLRTAVTDSKDHARLFILLGARSSHFRMPYYFLSTIIGFITFTIAGGCWYLLNSLLTVIGIGYTLTFPIELLFLPALGIAIGWLLAFVNTRGIAKITQYRF